MISPLNTNDGTQNLPALKIFINADNLLDLREDSLWHHRFTSGISALLADGFEGIQQHAGSPLTLPGEIPLCSLDRINAAEEAESVAARYADQGYVCLTVHAGWGIEDDSQAFRMVESILRASEKYHLPIYIETHRSTITQDIWRTVQIVKRFPEVRFNGDLSHYYCGQELVYGGLSMKMDFMCPILDRIAFLHARIASPGHIQAPIEKPDGRPSFAVGDVDYLLDFKIL